MRILFVCMGNICRSPSAENVMRHFLEKEGLEGRVSLDSAGTIGYHTGNRPDARMTAAANRRGIEMKGRARQVTPEDFSDFNLVLAMDRDNLRDLQGVREQSSGSAELRMFCEFCREHEEEEVPDPYYGGPQGFELVLDLLEDGCGEILRQLHSSELKAQA